MDSMVTIRDYISSTFAVGKNVPQITDGLSLIDSGIIDSLGIMKVLAFIENKFVIKIPEYDVVPENFDTIVSIATYVEKQLSEKNK